MNLSEWDKIMEFKFKKVDSEELLKEIYRVRYEVYCQECGFLPTSDYPDGLEIDEFDEHSSILPLLPMVTSSVPAGWS